jgi:hypothetical protein
MKHRFLLSALLISNCLCAQPKFGIESSYLATHTAVDVPGLLTTQVAKVNSGYGYFLSLGATMQLNRKITLRGGPSFWQLAFSPQINVIVNNETGIAKESGRINYSGIYLRMDRTWKYFFFTTGFDISFHNSYSCDLVVYDKSGMVVEEQKERTYSILTNSFNNQFSLVLGIGPKLALGASLNLKGFLAGEIPAGSIYNSGLIVNQIYIPSGAQAPDAHINLNYFPFLTYGIGMEYVFHKQ